MTVLLEYRIQYTELSVKYIVGQNTIKSVFGKFETEEVSEFFAN